MLFKYLCISNSITNIINKLKNHEPSKDNQIIISFQDDLYKTYKSYKLKKIYILCLRFLQVGIGLGMTTLTTTNNPYFKDLNIETENTGVNTTISNRINLIRNKIKSQNFLLLNGDAILDFNLKKIFNIHKKNKKDMTFISCLTKFDYGIVGKKNNKIISFERDIYFDSIKQKQNRNFIGHVYSGISIMNKKLLRIKFKNFDNFEKKFYPIVIKKFKTDLKFLNGFWSSVDNIKDIEILNNKSSNKFLLVKKLKKKLI